MSGIAAIYNVPTTPSELATWSFIHAAHHLDILRVIFNETNVQLASYQLDPFPKYDDPVALQSWLDNHQIMHNQMDITLSINGQDLDTVNWSDPNERAGWIWLNAQEHYQAAATLEIG